jgi:hypothetical protein
MKKYIITAGLLLVVTFLSGQSFDYPTLSGPNAFTGSNTFPVLGTATNCSGNGTSANPSVVSCASASAGVFSCDAASSTGTCVVDTTEVTTNSEVFVQPDSSSGARLGVTCASNADSGLSVQRLSGKTSGTFTINLGTFTGNPLCFDYFVVNH